MANHINIEFDETSREYYIVWEPVVIGSGKTKDEALHDLRQAAQYGLNTMIDRKLEVVKKED